MELTVEQIARLVGGTVQGDPDIRISGVNSIEAASSGELTFARSPRYFSKLLVSNASAALVPQPLDNAEVTTILVDHPDLAFFQVLQQFAVPPAHPAPGIHATAVVSEDAQLGASVAVGPNVCVESAACLGDNVVLYAGVYVGQNCTVGADTVIYPNAVIREDCVIGRRCVIHAGACIGSDGFGFIPMGGQWHKIPQTGMVVIGDDVEIGSNTTIDRATFGETKVGSGTKIDNLVQVGHNVCVGEHCAIAGMAGLAGSAVIGNHVRVGANAGVVGHIHVGDGVTIGGRAGVMRSVGANETVSGFPAIDHSQQRRVLVAQQRTPEMLRRIAELERQLKELKDNNAHETTDNS